MNMAKVTDGLKHYLSKKGVSAEFFEFDRNTMAAEDSSKAMGVPLETIVKTVVFTDGKVAVFAILQGNRRVSQEKLSKESGLNVRIAKAREVEELTSFKVGEVPPIGHPSGSRMFLDESVSKLDEVVAGGGSTHTLLKIKVKDIISLSSPRIASISE